MKKEEQASKAGILIFILGCIILIVCFAAIRQAPFLFPKNIQDWVYSGYLINLAGWMVSAVSLTGLSAILFSSKGRAMLRRHADIPYTILILQFSLFTLFSVIMYFFQLGTNCGRTVNPSLFAEIIRFICTGIVVMFLNMGASLSLAGISSIFCYKGRFGRVHYGVPLLCIIDALILLGGTYMITRMSGYLCNALTGR